MEALIGGIVAIALGVAANLLTPYAQKVLSIKDSPIPESGPVPAYRKEEFHGDLERWRANNRQRLHFFFWQIFVYGYSFFIIYIAFYGPF